MSVVLYRIDDRLIHGQVVVGWGQPFNIRFIVLVDDAVATSDWEQDLYRAGVPPEMELFFESVEGAARRLPEFEGRADAGIVLAGDIATMQRLIDASGAIHKVNLGGIHHRVGRSPKLRYVFLTAAEEQALLAMAEGGVSVSAQDVPACEPVSLRAVLAGSGA
ncbi:MAG: PTS sugar transporter subunit IIB [Gemmatimonadetes bacterium]|nr:PTS sugar transporter subunit IIB [Gemmatimonadota bacterium]MBI3568383.1 PTS sugar transporter subunit IIB [Gemmatimonadota bacterium]